MPTATHEVVERWRAGETCAEIGWSLGVTRQRISQLLIEAGYSPAERNAARRAEQRDHQSAFREQRAASISQRAADRDRVVEEFAAYARELGVTPRTLGAYTAGSAKYATAAGTRGGVLPPRKSAKGVLVAKRAARIAQPWSVRTISAIAAAR